MTKIIFSLVLLVCLTQYTNCFIYNLAIEWYESAYPIDYIQEDIKGLQRCFYFDNLLLLLFFQVSLLIQKSKNI
jgi:hypothetical protein